MKPFIHSVRSGIHIIDLDQTRQRLDEACNFMRRAARNRKQIVFVGRRRSKQVKPSEKKHDVAVYITSTYVG